MKKILILVLSNLKHDARVMRQIDFLKHEYAIIVACYDIAPTANCYALLLPRFTLTFFRRSVIAVLLLLKRFSWAYSILFPYRRFLVEQLKNEHYDLIIANDIETLPLAFHLKRNQTKVLFDAHEYAPRHFENKLWWRIFFQPFNTFFCKKYIPLVDGMTTMGQGIANEYEKNFGVKPVVVTNSTYYYELKPLKISDPSIRLVHHGIVNRSRKIELIIEIMQHLPEHFTLDLVLLVPSISSPDTVVYLNELKSITAKNQRIRFPDPVSSHEIVPMLYAYDMGIILAPPINFNYANGLPNKLYDYIQGRLGVITGPTPEIAKIVNDFGLGIVADDFTPISIALKVAEVTREKVNQFKEASDRAAIELSAEKNRAILQKMVASILKAQSF
jgi:glycosyltransferase involved in cell wall biosynthesis